MKGVRDMNKLLMVETIALSMLIASPVFLVKMCLIMAAGLNAAIFHSATFPSVNVWDAAEMRPLGPPPSARLAGALSLALWASVIACGVILANF